MKSLASLQKDVAEYIGIYSTPISDLGSILSTLVAKHSCKVYFDDDMLQSALHELGTTPSDIYKVCLMTKVTGFRDLMECDSRTQQIDLDRFVQNAVEETGFNRTTVMKLTGDIALSADIVYNCNTEHFATRKLLTETAYVVPASLYESEIKAFKESFEKSAFRDKDVNKLDFSKLQPLVAAGIPKAKFYLGYCLLHGIQFEVDNVRAINLLQEAADAGVTQATATLGDYYYDKGVSDWGKAYEYYTGFGSLALSKKRKDAIVSILNQKKFNRSMIGLSITFFLAIVATLILAPGAPLYVAHRVIGSIFTLLSLAILALAILHHRIKPYDTLYYVPIGMFTMWFFYMAIRFLF